MTLFCSAQPYDPIRGADATVTIDHSGIDHFAARIHKTKTGDKGLTLGFIWYGMSWKMTSLKMPDNATAPGGN